jgi:hypothetical protein
MHTHNHGCCEHCLHFCKGCNVVYCCKCKEEWTKCCHWYTPYYPTVTWTTTCGSSSNYMITDDEIKKSGAYVTYTSGGSTTCSHTHGEEITKKK